MKKIFIALFVVVLSVYVTVAQAAAPDGNGPWADAVTSSSQGLMKNGSPVPAIRSDASSAVGVAEGDTTDGNFFSLGFGGNIVLRFDNPISNGVITVEATNDGYPTETASVDLSADGVTWMTAGSVSQDGSVAMPEGLTCAQYVRITDTSNPENFVDETADAYDVDGVSAQEGQSCEFPTPTPSPTGVPGPTGTPGPGPTSTPGVCNASKPNGAPTLTVERTSGTTAKLTWTAVSPVTHYAISYGTTPGNYAYGVPNTGNVTTYNVGGLNNGTNYYFIVRGINDCTPGDPSGEKSMGGNVLGASTGGQVLGASTSTLAATGSFGTTRTALALVAMTIAAILGMTFVKTHETH
jgi:hypothetical protein